MTKLKNIVLDASTLILLAKMDLLRTLTKQVNILIPTAVKEESTKKKELFDAQVISQLIADKKIQVISMKQTPLIEILEKDFLLGKGESQAITLAKTKKTLLGIDDKQGIKACKVLGLKFTTVLAFIIRFYEKGLLKRNQALAKLERLNEYGWYPRKFGFASQQKSPTR